jgi:hypothetical protein
MVDVSALLAEDISVPPPGFLNAEPHIMGIHISDNYHPSPPKMPSNLSGRYRTSNGLV